MKTRLIVATGNAGKLREIGAIFGDFPLQLLTMKDFWNPLPAIEESGSTFAENAGIKADWVFKRTGLWSLGDDSGLSVDALGGAPGIRSARFAGDQSDMEENKRKLLDELAGVPPSRRTARFVCAMALRIDAETLLETEGICEGTIIDTPRGSGGFGYDPLFVPGGSDRTFAELGGSEKHAISHRGRALRNLKERLREYIAC